MATVIKKDGSMATAIPANGRTFTAEELRTFGELGFVVMGSAREMGREDRAERMEGNKQ